MMHPWPDLVLELEAIELDAYFQDPEGLREAMAQRARIIGELARADPSWLEDELREQLLQRLAQVHERDKIVLRALVALRDATREELGKADTGKRALNGYQSMVSSEPPPFRRIG